MTEQSRSPRDDNEVLGKTYIHYRNGVNAGRRWKSASNVALFDISLRVARFESWSPDAGLLLPRCNDKR
jgi:hypothetical protein